MVTHRGKASAVLVLSSLALAGCKVVSIQKDREARARRSDTFDAASYVADVWRPRIVPQLDRAAIDASALPPPGAPQAALDALGRQHGLQAGEGSMWTFVVRGEGTVTAIDRHSRQGRITLAGPGAREITLEIGPVITESTVRDALPMFDFNDFSGQMAFAAVSRALNMRAQADCAAVAARLVPGQHVRFLGVAHVAPDDGPLRILPVQLETAG